MEPVTSSQDPGTQAGASSRVPFRVHARALAALGRDLVTDDMVAVMELVKNSYDALATRVDVRIRPAGDSSSVQGYVEVADDGHGMDYDTVRDVWCVIATPSRAERPVVGTGRRAPRSDRRKGTRAARSGEARRRHSGAHQEDGWPSLGVLPELEQLVQGWERG